MSYYDDALNRMLAVRERPSGQMVVMYQSWRSLLFLHWAFDPEVVQRRLPPGLRVHTFDGRAYVGIVPFFMRNIRPRFLPAVPGISNFLEVNVRTYVTDKRGTPGVWFYSLDANQWLAVQIARALFHLPYFQAKMQASSMDLNVGITYDSQRTGTKATEASRFTYQPQGETVTAQPGTLAFFLIERYILFAPLPRHGLASGQVHHAPYKIAPAMVDTWDSQLLTMAGFPELKRPPDHALVSPGVDVDIYPVRRIPR